MFRAKLLIVTGCLLILMSSGLSYYTFFVPKVGPLGNGTYSWTVYVQLICPLFIGITAMYKGVYAIRNNQT